MISTIVDLIEAKHFQTSFERMIPLERNRRGRIVM